MTRVRLASLIIAVMCLPFFPSYSSSEPPPDPFCETELVRFIDDISIFMDWLNQNYDPVFPAEVMEDPFVLASRPETREHLFSLAWRPKRFAYIFHHVVLGGYMMDMNGYGEGILSHMLNQKEEVAERTDLSIKQKEDFIQSLDRDIERLLQTSSEAKMIPHNELLLMWKHRKALWESFGSRVQVKKRQMPNN